MMSDLSESFFVISRGNLANYVLLYQISEITKKVLKGQNKGVTLVRVLGKFASSLSGQIRLHSVVLLSQPIRTC